MGTNDAMSATARGIVGRSLRTMRHVEALMLFAHDQSRLWDADQLARRLHLPPALAAACLADLEAGELIEADAASRSLFRYAPAPTIDRAALTELFTLYRQRPIVLVRAVYERRPASSVEDPATIGDATR